MRPMDHRSQVNHCRTSGTTDNVHGCSFQPMNGCCIQTYTRGNLQLAIFIGGSSQRGLRDSGIMVAFDLEAPSFVWRRPCHEAQNRLEKSIPQTGVYVHLQTQLEPQLEAEPGFGRSCDRFFDHDQEVHVWRVINAPGVVVFKSPDARSVYGHLQH